MSPIWAHEFYYFCPSCTTTMEKWEAKKSIVEHHLNLKQQPLLFLTLWQPMSVVLVIAGRYREKLTNSLHQSPAFWSTYMPRGGWPWRVRGDSKKYNTCLELIFNLPFFSRPPVAFLKFALSDFDYFYIFLRFLISLPSSLLLHFVYFAACLKAEKHKEWRNCFWHFNCLGWREIKGGREGEREIFKTFFEYTFLAPFRLLRKWRENEVMREKEREFVRKRGGKE